MADAVVKIRLVPLECRVGGRFGPTPKSGRRGNLLWAVEVPETLRDYLVDMAEAPVPEALGAVYLYLGDELIKTWRTKDHEVSLARQAELSDLDVALNERRAAIRAAEQQTALVERATTIAEASLQHLEQARRTEAVSLAAERQRSASVLEHLHAQEQAEHLRVAAVKAQAMAELERLHRDVAAEVERINKNAAAELERLGTWVEVNRMNAVASCEAVRTQLETSVRQVGSIAEGVMLREGRVAELTGSRQVDAQTQALNTTALFGELVGKIRELSQSAELAGPLGPGVGEKLVDLAKQVFEGPLVAALAQRIAPAAAAAAAAADVTPPA